jgi:hypothetical protein
MYYGRTKMDFGGCQKSVHYLEDKLWLFKHGVVHVGYKFYQTLILALNEKLAQLYK